MFCHNNQHFLLVGHEGCHNRGCEALVRTTISILRGEFPKSLITLASKNPEEDVSLLDIKRLEIISGISRTPYLYKNRPAKDKVELSLFYRLKRILENRLKSSPPCPRPKTEVDFRHVRHLKKTMLSTSAVISIGGDMFIEDYGPPFFALEPVEYAQFLGCKTIVWGASIWPFKTPWLEDRVKAMLKRCALVTVRDDSSLKYLSKMGIEANVVRVADGAFLMPPRISSRTRINWSKSHSFVVGFNGSTLIDYYLSKSKSQQVVMALIDFFRELIDKYNGAIILLPHDVHERGFLFEMRQALDKVDSVYLPPLGLDAQETKAVISQCDFFIGMRFHPTIASLSQFIPTLGISHSPKFVGLHKEVYGNTNYLIPYKDVSVDILSKKFKKLRANKKSIQKRLKRYIPQLQILARKNAKYIKSLLT